MPKPLLIALVLTAMLVIISDLWNLGTLLANPAAPTLPILIYLIAANGSLVLLFLLANHLTRRAPKPTVSINNPAKNAELAAIIRAQREQIQRWGTGR